MGQLSSQPLQIDSFHASAVAGITRFAPATHFGSRRQALACAGAHFWVDYPGCAVAEVTLYRVRIHVPACAVLGGPPEWGAPGASGLALALRHYRASGDCPPDLPWEIEPAEFDALLRQAHHAIKRDVPPARFWAEHWPRLVPRGVRVLRYTNTGQFDQISPEAWCVLDPALVEVVAEAPVPITDVLGAMAIHAAREDGRQAMAAYCRTHRLKAIDWLR